MLEAYVKMKKSIGTNCNNDKTRFYTFFMKCKTIGVLIASTNCGIILGFRELFGSESPTQVANFYMDLIDHYQGNFYL